MVFENVIMCFVLFIKSGIIHDEYKKFSEYLWLSLESIQET